MISDNKQGNPNHDAEGKFTSGGNIASAGGQPPKNPNEDDGKFSISPKMKEKLEQMGFKDEKSERKQKIIDYIKKEFTENGSNRFNYDAGLLPYEYGYENTGYEDLVIDLGTDGNKFYVYEYLENENGPLDDSEAETPVEEFDSIEEMADYLENMKKENK